MNPGDKAYISRVAYVRREQFDHHCTLLTIERTTPKAVLLSAGDSQQWFPRSIIKPATNARHIYLIPRWFKLTEEWQKHCGAQITEPEKPREKNPDAPAKSST